MKQSVRRAVPHGRERVFDLVADVTGYPDFLPLWKSADVLDRDATGYRTRQSLGIGPAKLDFVSRTDLWYPERIVVTSQDGPLRELRMEWTLEEMEPRRCLVGLDLIIDVHSRVLRNLLKATYGEMAPKLIASFEGRARAIDRGQAAPPPSAAPG